MRLTAVLIGVLALAGFAATPSAAEMTLARPTVTVTSGTAAPTTQQYRHYRYAYRPGYRTAWPSRYYRPSYRYTWRRSYYRPRYAYGYRHDFRWRGRGYRWHRRWR
ncbi:MAG: hypothetical protein E7773_07545 [Sphingomonas sp.]|uniref:hypothetical protein n=1 Tax=Sphingomonas sp. TaxID=28214 RepID=UPI0011FD3D91|nr:hypothetical protein [Sphingomonas sp.]THD36840.1 MAG: hypothetical protein E7773_07545 [Sphingomonas sp.]